ncbi:unnamed protein product [Fusarium venenatum]|uniref:Uncharacterized protein n=1 Tax=Fusarium venenatum TaxID=56646 RepID=A0A2L2SU03_9HYPO|nr:uncharacterized protein FVRRES_13622 [Fusarium venenatum]CEI41532.1 unnamed protein product [Fusarium venenatum]
MLVQSTKGLTTAPVATLTAAHIQVGRLRTRHSLKKTEKKQAAWPSGESDVTASVHLSWQDSTTEGRTRLNNGMLTAMEKMGGMKRYGTGVVSTKGGRLRVLGEYIVARSPSRLRFVV